MDWARIPSEHDCGLGSRTHGVAALRDGRIAVLAQSKPAVHFFDTDGRLVDCWGSELGGSHGLSSAVQDGEETLWITDQTSGHVGQYSLSGKILQTIEVPPGVSVYSPTQVAVAPNTRDVWVADGYGSNVIRRYSASGKLLGVLTGEAAPACFARPHGLAFADDGTLYVADRRNRRMIAYTEEGEYQFHVDGAAHSPCTFATAGDLLYVPELFGGLKVFCRSLTLLREIGGNVVQRPVGGWAGQQGWGWPVLPEWPDGITGSKAVDRWIAPHDAAVSADGTVYVVEWVLGGRISRLQRESPPQLATPVIFVFES